MKTKRKKRRMKMMSDWTTECPECWVQTNVLKSTVESVDGDRVVVAHHLDCECGWKGKYIQYCREDHYGYKEVKE